MDKIDELIFIYRIIGSIGKFVVLRRLRSFIYKKYKENDIKVYRDKIV